MVEALYKPEGSGFKSRSGNCIFSIYVTLPTAPWTCDLLSIKQKLVPEDLSGGKLRPAHKAENLTAICEPIA
jgi:hypothetical protein